MSATSIPLEMIRDAANRIAPHIRKTPLLPFDYLTTHFGKTVYLKCEMFQRTGSFKLRGATNCILSNLARAKKSGVVAASAGNHAQGVAAVCRQLDIQATIVMPTITPPIKVQNTKSWGAQVQLVGTVYDEAFEHARKLEEERGYLFIHPFRDPLVMAGQGTIALELCEEPLFREVEAVVIPVGGGGLSTGVASGLRALRPDLKIYGVTARNAPATWKSFHKGSPLAEDVKFTLAEGVATKRTDESMLPYLRHLLDDILCLGEEAIAHAISILAERGKIIVEGAGALPLAAVLENLIPHRRIALVLSGGNIDLPALAAVVRRGLVEQGRLARLIITIMDRPGGLLALTQVFAEQGANVLQVFHSRDTLRTGIGEAEVEVELETRGVEHTDEVIRALTARGLQARREGQS